MAAVVDGHHLLPRYRQGTIAHERHNSLAVMDAEIAADQAGQRVGKPAARDPVDAVRLRGIPCVGPGTAGGAIRGTRPDIAVLGLDK